ncbi:uncharacterized protein GIQ15_02858 [Arthroderma uncinatum]|uniref:uncharacterized protein n=1 Tax=Arthroderma uncinatum TaxID=74035 RepID=UPI00144ADC88|nr:uncharacterized protein GIQ15_02858 [Arthroderma uncinatum]KAF3483534.1 hypothetical protein GIQ15_02858 [Arthroderma uncinatum]
MPTLAVTNFNVVCATLGGFITLFGLVSYLFKERFYLSEALISLLAGVTFSPHAANLIRPIDYALGNREALDDITLYFSRLVLGVQLVLAGVQLPSRYLLKEWKSLSLLLGPGMLGMWLCSSLVIYGLVPKLPFLHALAIAACITPTDPVLSNSIVKGKFADKNIPRPLQRIIIAESGANDGLGYPFLFFALYLIQYTGPGGTRKAMGLWFGETWGYTILLSVVYGVAVGWVAKELLHWAEENKYIDRESFLVFAVALALFIIGTCGMIGSDDVLACFIAGNVFTIDDWFRLETLDDSLQPTIDMLLNLSVFMWFGAVCPWPIFLKNDIIPIYRLIGLGILILLLRRLPVVFAMHKYIHQIEEARQAAFVGFFGPIGVSAIFYLYVTLEYIRINITVDGEVREDAKRLADTMYIVVWFLTICSIVVHGLSIPVGKLGFSIPRTLSSALSTSIDIDSERDPRSGDSTPGLHRISTVATSTPASRASRFIPARFRKQPIAKSGRPRDIPPTPVAFRIGRTVIPERSADNSDVGISNPIPSSTSTIASPPIAGSHEQDEEVGLYTTGQDTTHYPPGHNERRRVPDAEMGNRWNESRPLSGKGYRASEIE